MENMYVLNSDTIWYVDPESSSGGVFRSNNGGANWIPQGSFGSNNPAHIYMYNARIGFIDAGSLRRTTDGGTTWTPIIGAGNFLDMFFIDSLTGWKCNLDMKKTTDGGLNWVSQTIPSNSYFIYSQISKLSYAGNDTIWGVGGNIFYPSLGNRGVLYRTTNGGNNWLFQVPDSINITTNQYFFIKFINNRVGWAYHPFSGIHTTTGGDPVWYTGIQKIKSITPKDFILYQNYPNPFNPRTVINYEIRSASEVRLSVYNIQGKHVIDLVNNKQSSGKYEVDFSGSGYSSGVYFYNLIINGKLIDTKKMILVK